MPFTECKNCTWNGFYGSLNFRQIRLRFFFLFLPTFQLPRFLTMFPCSDIFENWYVYSLNQYLNNFFLIFWISDLLVEFHPLWIQNTLKNVIYTGPSWDLEKKIQTDSSVTDFIFSGYSTLYTMVHGTWKNPIATRLQQKKKYFRIWPIYYHRWCQIRCVLGDKVLYHLFYITQNSVVVYGRYIGPRHSCKPRWYIGCLVHYSTVCRRKSRYTHYKKKHFWAEKKLVLKKHH